MAAASYSARSLRLIFGSQARRRNPECPSKSRELKVSYSLRVISSWADSNSVRSVESRLTYSLMPFWRTMACVSAVTSNSARAARLAQQATVKAAMTKE